jgi:Protein of unknown function (DUF3307)
MTRFLLIILIHVFGDFFFQGDRMTWLKFFRFSEMVRHVLVYTLILFILGPVLLQITLWQSLVFAIVNGTVHLAIDYFTGAYRKRYWERDEARYSFVMGIDQILHILVLIFSFMYLIPNGLTMRFLDTIYIH